MCTNTIGSFTCSCSIGYLLNSADNRTCNGMIAIGFFFPPVCTSFIIINHTMFSDVNECATLNGGCSQICTNIIGSYYCSCSIGYLLSADNRTCNGTYVISISRWLIDIACLCDNNLYSCAPLPLASPIRCQ